MPRFFPSIIRHFFSTVPRNFNRKSILKLPFIFNVLGNFGLKWHYDDTLYILDSQEIKGNTKFVGFDMVNRKVFFVELIFKKDSTLVEPKSGAKFPKSRGDWQWWDDKVPEKLKELNKQGYFV